MNESASRQSIGRVATDTPAPQYSPDEMGRLVETSFCNMDYRVAASRLPPLTGLRGVGLGAVGVYRHDGVGNRFGVRASAHIRHHWSDDFVISMPLDARVTARQGGFEARLLPGEFVFLSTARPFDALLEPLDDGESCSIYLARVSGSLLRQYAPLLDRYCGMGLRLEPGAGMIMRALFDLALAEGAALSPPQSGRFGDMILTAVSNVASEISGSPQQRKSVPERVRNLATAYIQENLSNPALGDELIARHCKVSKRSLQSAFALVSTTVGKQILEQRLRSCHMDLTNPALVDRTILDIALAWGFSSASQFSRAYRARYGVAPRDERRHRRTALGGAGAIDIR